MPSNHREQTKILQDDVLKTHSNMRRKIPSTSALTAFEAAARHQSFTRAGEEVALTQSAVGRQIANLESFLGVALFRRTRTGIVLTPAGVHYSQTVRKWLDAGERDAMELVSRDAGGGTIELGVVPTFATQWLVPRLARFTQRHPQICVNLHVRTRPLLFEDAGLDAAIHAGGGGWPGTCSQQLMPETMAVVASPVLLGRRKRRTPAEIQAMPLLRMTTRPDAWRQWFVSQDMSLEADIHGPRFELFSMAIQAAIHGLGVALVPALFVESEIREGRLVRVLDKDVSSGLSYHFIYPEAAENSDVLRAFQLWIAQEAASSST